MAKIRQLSQYEVQKIAAGQVVDRPANVVKELVENSIDAQATQISIYIQDGGKKLIRIVDNGTGMSKIDAKICFKEHATSKIQRISDLSTINTFGFRGEALASIAAISKVILITKEQEDEHGIKLELENGTFITEGKIASRSGTDISVKNIFYNIPARQKFLKKTETEQRHIMQLCHAFCLDHLHINFKVFQEGKQILHCPSTQDILSRITQLWDHNFSENMLIIESQKKEVGVKIHGAISKHQYFRYDRNNIFFFVNKRWIRNTQLSSALSKGYINVLPPGKFPAAYIFIEIDPLQIDINIHPRKEEIKFLHPHVITKLLQSSIKNRLEQYISSYIKKEVKLVDTTFNANSFDSNLNSYNEFFSTDPFEHIDSIKPEKSILTNETLTKTQSLQTQKNNLNPISCLKEHQEKTIATKTHEILGQYKKTYILLAKSDGVFFIDQHAAHERILYEIFSQRFEEIAPVRLLFPQIINIKEQDMKLLEENLAIFAKNGIQIELFGQNQLIVQATPVHIKDIDINDLIVKVICWITEFQNLDEQEFFKTLNEKLHAQMACKAAIKAGDTLDETQIIKLLDDLEKTPNKLTCPHGRPTGWLLNTYEIEKKFNRKT